MHLSSLSSSFENIEVYGAIASGGMATIEYAGQATPAGTMELVLKQPHARFASDPEFVAMFLDEARLSLRIRHANVVRTLGVYERPQLALALEYVPGETLHDLFKLSRLACQPIPTPVATALIVGILHGLHGAHHTLGEDGQPLHIVHRDVTPGNILVGADGVPRLLDFGIAKAAGKLRCTPQGELKGKLAYIAPEHAAGAQATHQSDVYSAALVLWEALAGRCLFGRSHDSITFEAVMRARVPSLCSIRCDVPETLDAIVRRALARDPADRFESAADLARALETQVGVASQSIVMDWLEQLAGERLAQRREQLQMMRSGCLTQRTTHLYSVPAPQPSAAALSTSAPHTVVIPASKDTIVVRNSELLALTPVAFPTRVRPAARPRSRVRWVSGVFVCVAVAAALPNVSAWAPHEEPLGRGSEVSVTNDPAHEWRAPEAPDDPVQDRAPPLQLVAADASQTSTPRAEPRPVAVRRPRALGSISDFGPRSARSDLTASQRCGDLTVRRTACSHQSVLDTGWGRR